MKVKIPYLKPDEKTGVLRYRRVFRPELRPYIAAVTGRSMTEWKRTLEARSITEAGAMARYEAEHARCEQIVAQARKLAAGAYDRLDDGLINNLVEGYLSAELAADADARLDPGVKARGELVTAAAERAGHLLPPHRATARWAQGYRVAIETALDIYRGYSADGDLPGILSAWGDHAASLGTSKGFLFDRSSPAFRDLCVRLNETAIAVHEAELDRMDGKVIPTPPPPELPKRAAPRTGRKTFRTLMLELIEKPRLAFQEPTKERVRGGLRFLVEAVGDLRPEELTREQVTVFLDLLAQRPSKLPTEDYCTKLPELVAKYADRPEVPRLTQKTMEAYVIALSARWKDAQKDGMIPRALENPFGERQFRREVRKGETPKGFTADELKAYFSLPPFANGERPVRGKGEAVFWIPLLLLFTGARPEEVAQLLVADIFRREGDGRWVLRFTDGGVHPVKGRQSLKTERTESGRRTFLVPQPLLDLGLIDYRDHLEANGELALFPLLRRKGKRSGIFASFGEWMGPYVYAHGVLVPGQDREPLREFRHTWATAARVSRIPKEARKYIQGHKDKDDNSSSDDYGALEALGDRIDDFRLPIDLLALVPPWKAPG